MTQSSKQIVKTIVTVVVLNDLRKKVPISPEMTVQQLFDGICERLNLVDTQYFSIAEQLLDEQGTPLDRFLDLSATLAEERINSRSVLAFKMKHIKKPIQIEDPVAEELIYKQIQQNIVMELYPCPERIAIMLASLSLQATFGDYNPKKHRVGYLSKVGLSNYLPRTVSRHDYAYWQERLFALHARHKGLNKKAAMQKYMDLARDISYFGMSFFELKDDTGLEILLAVAEDGVFIFNAFNLKLLNNITFEMLVRWRKTDIGLDIMFEERDELQCISLATTPLKQKEILGLLDEYYALLPDKLKSPRVKPNNPEPIMLDDASMYVEPKKRVFLGRFGSRLEYLKGYYMESCSLAKLVPIRKFCQQIDTAIDMEENLESIDLSSSKLTDLNIEFVTKSIVKTLEYEPEPGFQWVENFDLQRLDLSGNQVEEIASIMELITKVRSLRFINLSNNKLGLKGASMLAEPVIKLNKIEELILSDCDLGSKGVASLCEAFKWKKTITTLNLSGNGIDDKTVATVLKNYIEESKLKTLDLSNNKIGLQGLELLMKALESKKSVTTFKLSHNLFGNKGGALIAQMLSTNTCIKHLVLKENKFLPDSFLKLGKAFALSPELETIDLEGNLIGKGMDKTMGKEATMFLAQSQKLQRLVLDSNMIDSTFSSAIADNLKQNHSLRFLSIALNPITQAGELTKQWAELLRYNVSIETLDFTCCGIENFSSVLGPCEGNRALKILILNGNQAKEGLQDLPAFLASTSLTRISLDNICLSDSIACSICESLKTSNSLEFLSIRGNNISQPGLERMATILAQNKSLITLEVVGNKYEPKEAKSIFLLFLERTSIREIIV
jgi:Ran GTPase-activating protein (RanGAP) involved in mRNA processing and transport